MEGNLCNIANKYIALKKIGSGSFGVVYKGKDTQTEEIVAIKLESINSVHNQLFHESKIIQSLKGEKGFPKFKWYGEDRVNGYNVMVTNLLGNNLESLFQKCKRKFTLKSLLLIADQMIKRIEYLHNCSFIHRDIKPENFLVGLKEDSTQIHLIDFGLSKKFRDPKTGLHIPYRENKNFTGTARYASINTHLGKEQSRRDDLESIGYIFVYFLQGCLPWQGLQASNKKEKYKKILKVKSETSTNKICKNLPKEIEFYLNYCKSMKFNERPDYNYILSNFKELFYKNSFFYDQIFDWTEPNDENNQRENKDKLETKSKSKIEIKSINKSSLFKPNYRFNNINEM